MVFTRSRLHRRFLSTTLTGVICGAGGAYAQRLQCGYRGLTAPGRDPRRRRPLHPLPVRRFSGLGAMLQDPAGHTPDRGRRNALSPTFRARRSPAGSTAKYLRGWPAGRAHLTSNLAHIRGDGSQEFGGPGAGTPAYGCSIPKREELAHGPIPVIGDDDLMAIDDRSWVEARQCPCHLAGRSDSPIRSYECRRANRISCDTAAVADIRHCLRRHRRPSGSLLHRSRDDDLPHALS